MLRNVKIAVLAVVAAVMVADAQFGPAMADEDGVPDFTTETVLETPTQAQMDAVGPTPAQFDAVNKAVESLQNRDLGAELGAAVNGALAGK